MVEITYEELLADLREQEQNDTLPENPNTCKTCIHRVRSYLNMYSNKVVQSCELQSSKRSNSGFKTIKTTDKACYAYEKGV